MLKKYQILLSGNVRYGLTNNEWLDWSEELLKWFKDTWDISEGMFRTGYKQKTKSAHSYSPKELEEVISQLEKEVLDADFWNTWRGQLPLQHIFNCNNSLRCGFEYTFNTTEKRKVLDDAVEIFLTEQCIDFIIGKILIKQRE